MVSTVVVSRHVTDGAVGHDASSAGFGLSIKIDTGLIDIAGCTDSGGNANNVIGVGRESVPFGIESGAAAGIHGGRRDVSAGTTAARHGKKFGISGRQGIVKTLTVAARAHKFNDSDKAVSVGGNDVTSGKSGIRQCRIKGFAIERGCRVDIRIRPARRTVGRGAVTQFFGQISNMNQIAEVDAAVAVRIYTEVKITAGCGQSRAVIV